MASVFEREGRWIAKFKDGHGRWRTISTKARTKTEAKRLAHELELKAERQRMGLEELPPDDGGGTLAELLEWWLDTYVEHTSSRDRLRSAVNRHLMSSPLAERRLVHVTASAIEQFLQSKSGELAPQTLNHLRTFIATAFSRAKRAGKWKGSNPALDVTRRKVPKRLPNYLSANEVPLVLEALSEEHRPLFATAIFTGMRKGEIAGLLKTDVDLANNLLYIRRSYDRDTTKGGAAAAIPIAAELRPFLEVALRRAKGALLFPGPDGAMLSVHSPLEDVLRRALGRAGIVERYVHVCRKKGCGYSEEARDNDKRRCPTHRHLLWPKAEVRRIRFHDLRHTTESLLMMAGANPAATQRILRHADPRITTEVYGHLAPNYLKDEIDRLNFGIERLVPPVERVDAANDVNLSPFGAYLVRRPSGGELAPFESDENPESSSGVESARPVRFERTTFGSVDRRSIQLSYGRVWGRRS